MKTIKNLLLTLLVVGVASSCNKTEVDDFAPANKNGSHKSASDGSVPNNNYAPLNKLGTTKLYYQYQQYTMLLKRLTDADVANARVNSTDQLFVYGPAPEGVSSTKTFYPVARQMLTQGQKLVLEGVIIRFNPGITPRQFYSSSEVYTAARGVHPLITMESTGVYFSVNSFTNQQPNGTGSIVE